MRAVRRAAWSWGAIGVAGSALLVACVFPAFELAIGAYTTSPTAGQRSYRYVTEVSFARDLRPVGLVPLAAGLLVVAAALVAVRREPPQWVTVGTLVVSIVLLWLGLDTLDRLAWSEGGVIGYAEPHGGPLLQPALDDLKADALRSPEARDPSWQFVGGFEHAYASRGLIGWKIFGWATAALFWLAGYRAARVVFGRWLSLGLVASATLAVVLWLFARAIAGSE